MFQIFLIYVSKNTAKILLLKNVLTLSYDRVQSIKSTTLRVTRYAYAKELIDDLMDSMERLRATVRVVRRHERDENWNGGNSFGRLKRHGTWRIVVGRISIRTPAQFSVLSLASLFPVTVTWIS